MYKVLAQYLACLGARVADGNVDGLVVEVMWHASILPRPATNGNS